MGNRAICRKKAQAPVYNPPEYDNTLQEKKMSRIGTVAAEEIMRKSVWFIEKEEVDNYFSNEELNYYKKTQHSKQFTDMLIPIRPAEIRWREGESIGQGAFGEVIMGFNEDNGQIMAVKQVNLKLLQNNETKINALELEIEILKQLKHENIVKYIGTQKTKDKLLIFLEYLSGGSISSLLKKYGKLNENIIRLYTLQILRGLEYLHYKNVMHRDIKGGNILLETGGVCKLADFGSSKQVSKNEDFHTLTGTANWMPPEIIQQTKGGRFSDIWSLGCTIIEMATGKPPWSQFNNPLTIMFQIASQKKAPPLPEGLAKETLDFLEKCLQVDPFKRYNCYKLLRHPFITGKASLLKVPEHASLGGRKNLKELSEIVEKEDFILNPSKNDEKNWKVGVESEMAYNLVSKESSRLKSVILKTNNSLFDKNPRIQLMNSVEIVDSLEEGVIIVETQYFN